MLEGPLLPSIILYTIPIILTSLLQLLFNAADLVIVGRYCGSVSLGAVGATGSITGLIVNLFVGLSVGAGVTVAQGIGAGDHQEVQRTVHTSLPTAFVCGVIMTVVGICCSEPLLKLLDTPESVLPLSASYLKIYFAGMTFAMVYNFAASILRAAGDTKSPLVALSLAGVLNVGLNILFVTAFQMNVAGVALATTISQGVSAVLAVIALMRRHDACRLHLKRMRIYREQLWKIIRIGLPAGIQNSLFAVANVLIQSAINSFGDVLLSGSSAASNIEGFAYVCINAFHQTAVNFTGQNVGARQMKRVSRIAWMCLICVTVVGGVVGVLAYGLGPQLLSIYITDSPEAIAYGMRRLACICLPYFLAGIQEVATGILRGLGASMAPMAIAVVSICAFRIGWIATVFQIPQFHTPECLFLSFPISWGINFVFQMAAYVVVYRRRLKQEGIAAQHVSG